MKNHQHIGIISKKKKLTVSLRPRIRITTSIKAMESFPDAITTYMNINFNVLTVKQEFPMMSNVKWKKFKSGMEQPFYPLSK